MDIELRHLIGTVKRLWWIPVAAALVLGLLGGMFARTDDRTYTSTTQMLVTSQLSGDAVLADESRTATFKNLATSGPVLDRVILELGLDLTRQELLDLVSVEVIGGTQIISIVVTTDDPQLSADIANSLARNFSTTATDISVGELQRNLDELTAQSETIRDRIVVIDTRLAEIDTEENADNSEIQAEISQLEHERLQRSQTLADIEQSIRKFNTSLSSMSLPIAITDFALPDEEGSASNPIVLGFLGIFVGGLLGAAYILWSAFTDSTLRNADQMNVVPMLMQMKVDGANSGSESGVALLAAKITGIRGADGGTLALISPRTTTDVDSISKELGEAMGSNNSKVVPVTGALDSPEGMRVALAADAAIVVATLGKSKLTEIDDIAEVLKAAGVGTIGSVIVKN